MSRRILLAFCIGASVSLGHRALGQSAAGRVTMFKTLVRFGENESVGQFSAAPNGQLILHVGNNELRIRNLKTGKDTPIARATVDHLAWSASGNRIAYTRYDGSREGYIWTAGVDPASGALTSPPQRVSVSPGQTSAISTDGQWIAYTGAREKDSTALVPIRVMPASGGPERVIARFQDGEEMHWSRDGRSLYLTASVDLSAKSYGVYKIFVDGRAPQLITSTPETWFAGMTRDRSRLLFVPSHNPVREGDQVILTDTLGVERSRAPLPAGTVMQYDGVIGDSVLVWESNPQRRALLVKPVSGGPIKRFPVVGESNEYPLWSPDGKRIAFHVVEGARRSMAIMNADGSNVRVFRDLDVRGDAWGMRWSPDARSIAVSSKDLRELVVYDVATGRSSVLMREPVARAGLWRWRSDGAGILSTILPPPNAPGTVTIEYLALGKPRVKLIEAEALPERGAGFRWINDSTVFIRNDSIAYAFSLRTGAARTLAQLPSGYNMLNTAISPDGRLAATTIRGVSGEELGKVELISLENGDRREISLPFWFLGPANHEFAPDGRTLFISGRTMSDSLGSNVYIVPLDGAQSRPIANLRGNRPGYSLAPDGRSLALSTLSSNTTELLAVDLRPTRTPSAPSPRR